MFVVNHQGSRGDHGDNGMKGDKVGSGTIQ